MTDELICHCCDKPFPEVERTDYDREFNPHVSLCADCLADFEGKD